MAARTADQRLHVALDRLQLQHVPHDAWKALRERSAVPGTIDDLHLRTEHVSAARLRAVAEALQHCSCSEGLWEWLSQAAEMGEGPREDATLPRIKALIALLWRVGTSPRLAGAAAAVYLTLLMLDGAARHWGSLFQPVVFQQALRTLQVLRAAAPSVGLEDLEQEQVQVDDDPAGSAEELEEARGDAMQLLDGFLRMPRDASALGASEEAVVLAVDALAALIQQPADEEIGRAAVGALAAVVAASSAGEDVRPVATAALNAVLPALLAGQALPSTASVLRHLNRARASALEFICEMVRSYPVLLIPKPSQTGCKAKRDQGSPMEFEDAGSSADQSGSDAEEMKEASQGDGGPLLPVSQGGQRGSHEEPFDEPRGRDGRLCLPRKASEHADDPILALLQRVCIFTPDRAELRSAAAQSVVQVLCQVATAERAEPRPLGAAESCSLLARFLDFLGRLLRSERTSCRGLAVEASTLVLQSRGALLQAQPDLARQLLAQLVERCGDAVPTVRSRALGGVATAVQHDVGLLPLRDLEELFRSAAADERPLARRAALGLFDAMLALLPESSGELPASAQLLDVLATDESPAVRRAAISSLALLLQSRPGRKVQELWAAHVLPLTVDVEAAVVERALDEVEAAIFIPLRRAAGLERRGGGAAAGIPSILEVLDAESAEYLQRAMAQLSRRSQGSSKDLVHEVAASLKLLARRCTTEKPIADWPISIWLLLEEVAAKEPRALPVDLVLEAWAAVRAKGRVGGAGHLQSSREVAVGAAVLRVLGQTAARLPPARAGRLAEELTQIVESFTAPIPQVQAMLHVIEQARAVAVPTPMARRGCQAARLLQQAVESAAAGTHGQRRCLSIALYVTGEAALAGTDEAVVSDDMARLVRSAAVEGTLICHGKRVELSMSERGQALAALGKLCLRSESLAKASVELLVLHLHEGHPFVVRNNVLVVLGDLCKQYAALVERFVPSITDILRDRNELLRHQALMVLASLLSEGFIRPRGSTLPRLLYTLGDPATAVQHLAECVVSKVLHKRQPSLFSHHFLDMVCVLNGWSGLPSHQGAVGNEDFSLATDAQRRATVYLFALAHMTAEQKFTAYAQVVMRLLASFITAETAAALPASCQEPAGRVLSDSLALIGCREMRACFAAKPASPGDDMSACTEAAGAALPSHLKRAMCEDLCPVLIQLKSTMEEQRSTFLGPLRVALRELLREYRDDIQELLAGDQQLASEVAFDLAAASSRQPRVCLVDLMKVAVTAPPRGRGEMHELQQPYATPRRSQSCSGGVAPGSMEPPCARPDPKPAAVVTPVDLQRPQWPEATIKSNETPDKLSHARTGSSWRVSKGNCGGMGLICAAELLSPRASPWTQFPGPGANHTQ